MNTETNIEDLLKPRIEVIAPYPLSPYKVGDLVELSDSGKTLKAIVSGNAEFWMPFSEIEKMKELFRPLPWWEKREESEMPEYVKRADTNEVIIPFLIDTEAGHLYESSEKHTDRDCSSLRYWLPATLAEYEAYKSQTPTP